MPLPEGLQEGEQNEGGSSGSSDRRKKMVESRSGRRSLA